MTANQTSTSAASLVPGAPADPPVHGCVRCGAPVAVDVALCEECNPLGLAQPSASQVHGTAFLGVVIAVILLAVLARVAISGVGPFDGQVSAVAQSDGGLTVTLVVTNNGTSIGSTTCRLSDPAARFGGASGYLQSPRIEPGATITFTGQISQLGTTPRLLAVECSDP